jgi:adenine phosphoribosyltransferase
MHEELLHAIRSVPNFPKEGIVFRDITTLLNDPKAFVRAADILYEQYQHAHIDKVVAVESRGFILGSVLAYRLNAGFVPIRKPGKLPAETIREEYALEYGTDAIEMHLDAIRSGERILMHDDLLATGGTIKAACRLVERAGGVICAASFLIELSFLNGRRQLGNYDIFSVIHYDSE